MVSLHGREASPVQESGNVEPDRSCGALTKTQLCTRAIAGRSQPDRLVTERCHSAAVIAVVTLAVLVLSSSGGLDIGWAEPAGDAKKGQARYDQYCVVCHGPRGLGDGPMAKATSPPATKLTAPEVRNKTDQDLLSAIADGVRTSMPAWRGLLSDQELQDVLAYIRSLSG